VLAAERRAYSHIGRKHLLLRTPNDARFRLRLLVITAGSMSGATSNGEITRQWTPHLPVASFRPRADGWDCAFPTIAHSWRVSLRVSLET